MPTPCLDPHMARAELEPIEASTYSVYTGPQLEYFSAMKIWTFTEAAKECGLKTSSGVTRRIQALERGGQGLSFERGEYAVYGGRRVLTDRGVERLKGFVRGKVGRRAYNKGKGENR